jgi:hypothetical protein
MKNKLLKSVLAVMAGMATVFILSVAIDALLEKMGLLKIEPFEFNAWYIITVVILSRFIFTASGGWLTASLAPARRRLHAIILGCIAVVINISGAIMMWNKTPHWFPILLCLLPLPAIWLGAIWQCSNVVK